MAYAALVRSACANTATSHFPAAPSSKDEAGLSEKEAVDPTTCGAEMYALGWYCVQILLEALEEMSNAQGQRPDAASQTPYNPKGKQKAVFQVDLREDTSNERVHRLHLTLISTMSSLPLPLLARVLPEVEATITGKESRATGVVHSHPSSSENQRRKELVSTLR